jgi:hypothetical protein
MKKTDIFPKVKIEEIGLYIKALQMDYILKDNAHIAKLITKNFNVLCKEEDILKYEELHHYYEQFREEDMELIARREGYFKSLGVSNPFY